jgi:rhamnose utilization protein RhaD (predicted bifunctional aldolase and dehydrogenase)
MSIGVYDPVSEKDRFDMEYWRFDLHS